MNNNSTIVINGNSYIGSSISISNGKITINGEDVTPDSKEISISVNGNIDFLQVDACNKVSVVGNVGGVTTKSGDVDISGDVVGGIQTMSGDVDCGNIGGSISTMSGDIKYKKLNNKTIWKTII